jgi:hypothetical protein
LHAKDRGCKPKATLVLSIAVINPSCPIYIQYINSKDF